MVRFEWFDGHDGVMVGIHRWFSKGVSINLLCGLLFCISYYCPHPSLC
jgi:hypothetical protein